MAFTTSWSVTDLGNKKYGDITNIVTVGVKCTVAEDSYKGEWTSSFKIGTADTTASGYIGFTSITEANCLEWVKVAMGSTAMNDAQAYGKLMIENQKSNSSNVGVVTNTIPWS
tara:strand:+ start:1370 stop:1708 length:339 start_codon:yes stop_codon:yes gene_type:complete